MRKKVKKLKQIDRVPRVRFNADISHLLKLPSRVEFAKNITKTNLASAIVCRISLVISISNIPLSSTIGSDFQSIGYLCRSGTRLSCEFKASGLPTGKNTTIFREKSSMRKFARRYVRYFNYRRKGFRIINCN